MPLVWNHSESVIGCSNMFSPSMCGAAGLELVLGIIHVRGLRVVSYLYQPEQLLYHQNKT